MSLRRCARVGLVFGFLVSALSMGASCYRAEIDLTPLLDDQAGGGASSAGGGAGESSTDGGVPMLVVGASDAGGYSGVGGGGASGGVASGGGKGGTGGGGTVVTCDRSLVDPVQARCQGFLKPTVAECHDGDPAGWDGCYAGGCVVCSNLVSEYPYYVAWHPCCELNSTCNRAIHPVTCNARCPPPTEHDKIAPCFTILP